jgi:hypothetical protein
MGIFDAETGRQNQPFWHAFNSRDCANQKTGTHVFDISAASVSFHTTTTVTPPCQSRALPRRLRQLHRKSLNPNYLRSIRFYRAT